MVHCVKASIFLYINFCVNLVHLTKFICNPAHRTSVWTCHCIHQHRDLLCLEHRWRQARGIEAQHKTLFLHNFHPLSQQTDTAYLSKVSLLVFMGIGLIAAVIGIVQIEVCNMFVKLML